MPSIFVTTLDQVPAGEGRNFEVAGRRIAVFHAMDGAVYASQPLCPHRHGPLADGLMGGATVVCPLHERVFDLRTGCGLSHEHARIEVFATRVEGARVYVDPEPLTEPTPEDEVRGAQDRFGGLRAPSDDAHIDEAVPVLLG